MNEVINIIANYEAGAYRKRFQQYYQDLKSATVREIKMFGKCEALEQICYNNIDLDVITDLALGAAVYLCLGENVHPQENPDYYISPNGKFIPWKNLNAFPNEIPGDYQMLYIKMKKNRNNDITEPRQHSGSYVVTYEQVDNSGGVTVEQNDTVVSQKHIEDAEREAQEIIAKAKAEAQEIVENANKQATGRISEAENRRARIITEAEESKRNLLTEADAYKQRIIAETSAEKQRILADAQAEKQRIIETNARDKIEYLVEKNLSNYVEKRCTANANQVNQMAELQKEIANENGMIKDTVSKGIGDVKTVVSETISSAIEAFENSMLSKVYEWQSAMYQGEFGPLVSCYTNLQKLLKLMNESIIATANEQDDASSATRAVLTQYYEKFNNFSSQFMRTMNRIGIKSYMPQVGEEFNSYYHAHDTQGQEYVDDEIYNGRSIKRCVEPGFTYTSGNIESVIFRAVVDTK